MWNMHERSEFHRGKPDAAIAQQNGSGDLWTPDQVSRRVGQATSPDRSHLGGVSRSDDKRSPPNRET